MIYFAQVDDDDGLIKVGYSSDPKTRLKQIGFDAQRAMILLAQAPGCPWIERHVHHVLAGDRATPDWPGTRIGKLHPPQEWYYPTKAVLAFIDGVKATGALPFGFFDTIAGQIYLRHERGERHADIARAFGVSRQRVSYSIGEIGRRRRHGFAPFSTQGEAA